MTQRKSNLDKITPHRLLSRICETGLLHHKDQDAKRKRGLTQGGCFGLTLLGQFADATSQRDLELLGHRLHPSIRRTLRLTRPPSDTTLARALSKLTHRIALDALQAQIRAMDKREELAQGTHGFHHVAIDGKQVHWFSSAHIKHPHVQAQGEHGSTLRVLRATHVGARHSTCILQSGIPSHTNEIGHLCTFLAELSQAYGASRFIQVISLDAGLGSLKAAHTLVAQKWEYLMRLKDTQPSLLAEAQRTLVGAPQGVLRSHGGQVEHRIWVHDLEGAGWLNWEHAGSFVRIERVFKTCQGEQVQGERIWVSSLRGLSLSQWAELCRGHWGCENGQHCVVDKYMGEDHRMSQLSRNPEVLLAVSVLRAMSLNLLNTLKVYRRAGTCVERSYKQVRQQIGSALEKAVDARRSPAFA